MSVDGLKILISFIGGLGLFIYGMHEMGDGLQNAAGSKMQQFLEVLTKNKLMGVVTGALVTMVIQSSSATTVMVVGFVNAQLMSLGQAVGVIMGANIGTTATSWIVAASEWSTFLKPTTIAPLAIGAGVVMIMASKKERNQNIGKILVGFGILFVGIQTMSSSVKPLSNSPVFQQAFIDLGANPILGILVGAGVTCILQSSSASVGILQSIAMLGLVPWSAAVYIILGQNIGTCITALLSSVGTSKNAKAAAYIHFLFNVIGSLIFMFIALFFFGVISPASAVASVTSTEISVFHSAFNIGATILLFPFANLLVKGASKMAGIDENEQIKQNENESHLDNRLLENPSIAVGVASQEISRMAEVTINGIDFASKALLERDQESIEKIFVIEENINEFESRITSYLTSLIRKPLSKVERAKITAYFHIISDLERVGDHLENLAELSMILVDENLIFSDSAISELDGIISTTKTCLVLSCESFKDEDLKKALKAIEIEDEIDKLVKQFSDNHITRLTNENCSVRAGIVFLDTLTNLERISDHANNIGEFVVEAINKKY